MTYRTPPVHTLSVMNLKSKVEALINSGGRGCYSTWLENSAKRKSNCKFQKSYEYYTSVHMCPENEYGKVPAKKRIKQIKCHSVFADWIDSLQAGSDFCYLHCPTAAEYPIQARNGELAARSHVTVYECIYESMCLFFSFTYANLKAVAVFWLKPHNQNVTAWM